MERATYKVLSSHKLTPSTDFHVPRSIYRVRADSPAIAVMTDLQQIQAATVAPEVLISQATQTMISKGVRLLFVTEKAVGLVGLITARDTMGERPVKLINERGGKHADLTVRDLMIPAAQIDVIPYAEVLQAEVGHVIATLKHFGRQHALVSDIDPLSGEEMIRGIFSATQIGRQLGVAVHPFEVAKTFAEIETALSA
jgi:CBS domain-containing protein